MDPQRWFLVIVLIIVAAVIIYRRFLGNRGDRDQGRRIEVQAHNQAQSVGEEISQREDRRLAGMTMEDRMWEQASLQRNRESQERTRLAGTAADQGARG